MSNEIAALNANSIVAANAASNLANLNTEDYQAIRTTIVSGPNAQPTAITERTTTPGSPTVDGRESSNVEIPQEVGDMILAQRGFESALTAIKARDEMFQDLMDLF